MPVLQVLALLISLPIAVVGTTLFVRAIRQIIATVKLGQPTHRTDNIPARSVTLVKETLGHTRMLQWSWVGAGHWFIMTGFGLLFFTLVTALGQLFDPGFHIPLLGHFFLFEWATELLTWVMLVAIVCFIYYRATRPKERVRGPRGRFFGSTMWQGYFVEMVILGVGICIVLLRGLEYAYATYEDPDYASAFHFPLTFWLGEAFSGISEAGLANLIWVVATAKIVISFTWMIVVSMRPSMGVAWHRFLAFFNIFFKRHATGRTALGGLAPMTSGGKTIDFEDLEDMDEDTKLGVGAIEDFSWKGILDFSTCTECGRCQSQCPAWNTDKPLSPKMLILQLRDHAYAKAPYLLADSDEARAALPAATLAEAERPLVGATEGDWAWNPTGGAVIDDDVLWNCTSCGACVQQCPVDIEHVDHIVDMRRYQVLVESNFPAELNGLFKGLENKGNPWNMSQNARLDWAKDLPFEVKVVGEHVQDLDEVEWLFWVGCAGAYEDRAKKTTRAVAELLDMAGVDFAVLGNGETCTGDPARRAGNEFVFQGLAAQNAETLKESKAKKVVSTCAHCFNTLKNEYAAFGVELEVVHHTQLLNRLVREKKLTPVATNGGPKRSVTYHDPCYIGRHNGVYSPPRELLNVIPDAELTEMPRNSERSFCCGAGGARMWMEEKIGERINMNRTQEAIDTGAQQIAVGCPFCRVMLSDGLTMKQSNNEASEDVEVIDVAQMLLASVKGESPKARQLVGAGAPAAPVETKAEPSSGDVTATEDTLTDTAEVGAATSGASSLFGGGDGPTDPGAAAEPEPDTADEAAPPAGASLFAPEAEKPSGSGSLFDTPGGTDDAAPAAKSTGSLFDTGSSSSSDEAPAAKSGGSLFDAGSSSSDDAPAAKSGGSLFDAGSDDSSAEPVEAKKSGGSLFDAGSSSSAEPVEATTSSSASTPATEVPKGGSLFDLAEPEETAVERPAQAEPESEAKPEPETKPETAAAVAPSSTASTPATEVPKSGSLFDLAEPEETAVERPAQAEPESEAKPEPETKPETAAAAAPSSTASTPATEVPKGGSLFDLAEPEETSVASAPAAPAEDAETEEPGHAEPQAAETTQQAEEPTARAEVVESSDAEPDDAVAAVAEKPVASGSSEGGLGGKYAPGRSMFDLPPAEGGRPEAAAPAAAPAPETAEQPQATAPESSDAPASAPVRSLKDIKASLAGGAAAASSGAEPESPAPQAEEPAAAPTEAEATVEESQADGEEQAEAAADAEVEAESQAQSQEESASSNGSRPAPTGEAHEPRKDADISGASSLFDL